MNYLKTPEVARKLGKPPHRLHYLLNVSKIPPPHKDCSGDYLWTPEDIERARVALANLAPRRNKKVVKG